MSDYTDLDHGQESYDLDHGHQEYGNEHDHQLDYQQYGEAQNYENDQHFDHGHAVEYDSPNGAHYEEQDYTNYDSHEAASHEAYGENLSESDHSAAYGEADYLREHFDAEYLHLDHLGGGQEELSAVSK
jgi:hypothetical protein